MVAAAASPDPDAGLMRAVARGDNAAMTRVIADYRGLVRLIGSRRGVGSLDDFAQDVWLKLFRAAGRFDRKRDSLATFVSVIAHRLAIDQHRRGRVRVLPAYGGEPNIPEAGAEAPEIMEPARIGHVAGHLRAVLEDTYLRGWTLSKQAAVHGLPLGTVKSKLNRALAGARVTPAGADRGRGAGRPR